MCFGISGVCQDVEESIDKFKDRFKDPLKINGAVVFSGQQYIAFGMENRQVPWSGNVNGSLNFDLLGLHIPVSMAMGSGGYAFNYRLPSYNFIGLSPSFKKLKLLVGNRFLELGKYSFSQHSFTGLGLEYTPGNWYVSGFYGRLRRSRPDDYLGLNNIDPYYERWGYGVKSGYVSKKEKLLVSLFKAWDLDDGLIIQDSTAKLSPSENVILSVKGEKSINEKITVSLDYANSGFTQNRNLADDDELLRSVYSGLLTSNTSTYNSNAFSTTLKYKLKTGSLQMEYERISPAFRTMGALFFNNDLENVNFGTQLRIFKKSLFIKARAGFQRNNLENNQSNSFNRFVGSLQAHFTLNQQLSFSAGYTNFNNVNRRRTFRDPSIPLVFTELILNNEQANFQAQYQIRSSQENVSFIQISSNYSKGNSILNDQVDSQNESSSLNTYLIYSSSMVPRGLNFGVNTGYQYNLLSSFHSSFLNFGVFVQKALLDRKVRIGLRSNFSRNVMTRQSVEMQEGLILNTGFTASYAINESISIDLISFYIKTFTEQSFSEFRNRIRIGYKFKQKL